MMGFLDATALASYDDDDDDDDMLLVVECLELLRIDLC